MTKSGRIKKLTKRIVDAVEAESDRFIVWDSGMPGFGLRVEPTGRKTFIARYRAGGGRTGTLRQATVGRYGTLTLEEGRAAARRLLGAASTGADPLGDRKRARQAGLTVAQICDWYIKDAEAGRLLGRKGRPIKASTVAMDRSRIETHVKPLIGGKRVANLAAPDLEAMQADIAAGKTAKPHKSNGKRRRSRGGLAAGGSGVAARTLGMMRTIFEHAHRARLIATNPARGARKMVGERRRRRLSLDEVRALGKAVREAAVESENATALAAIRFMLLSGFRRDEGLSIRRDWIVPAGGVDFPDTKSGPQVRPIGRAALDILKARAGASSDGGWLFPADRGDGHFVGLPKVLARVCARAKLTGVTAHVLRHTFASVAGDLGFSELTIAGLLGHSAGSVTAGYVHLDSALVVAADRVSATIADALDGKLRGKVIPIKREAR